MPLNWRGTNWHSSDVCGALESWGTKRLFYVCRCSVAGGFSGGLILFFFFSLDLGLGGVDGW